MIESIRIERFRGLLAAELDGIGPLTVITGPNGSGKTSLMEAGFIASSGSPINALAEVVAQRTAAGGARWIAGDPYSRIIVETDDASTASTTDYKIEYFHTKKYRQDIEPYKDGLEIRREDPTTDGVVRVGRVSFTEENEYVILEDEPRDSMSSRWVDPNREESSAALYSRLVRTGRKKIVLEALGRAMPRFSDLEILTESDGEPQLYVMQDGIGIPLGLAGDGVVRLVVMAMHVASAANEAVFIEEPENYLHPRAMSESARLMWDAVDEGAQIFLSTHSLEFIDALLSESNSSRIDSLVLFNVGLHGGRLTASRLPGTDIATQREAIESDLR